MLYEGFGALHELYRKKKTKIKNRVRLPYQPFNCKSGQTARVNPRIIHTRALQITLYPPRIPPAPRPQTELFIAPSPRGQEIPARIFTADCDRLEPLENRAG